VALNALVVDVVIGSVIKEDNMKCSKCDTNTAQPANLPVCDKNIYREDRAKENEEQSTRASIVYTLTDCITAQSLPDMPVRLRNEAIKSLGHDPNKDIVPEIIRLHTSRALFAIDQAQQFGYLPEGFHV